MNQDDLYDYFSRYKPFEIKKIDNNTVVIESNIIPAGSKKGYRCRLMFDFEKVTDFEYIEDINEGKSLHLTFNPAKMELIEVDRE